MSADIIPFPVRSKETSNSVAQIANKRANLRRSGKVLRVKQPQIFKDEYDELFHKFLAAFGVIPGL